MKKLITVFGLLTTLSLSAHYAVFLLGNLRNVSGDSFVTNTSYKGKTKIVEFINRGLKEVTVTNLQFNLEEGTQNESGEELVLLPGESARHIISSKPVTLKSINFYVEGETEELEVLGVIP